MCDGWFKTYYKLLEWEWYRDTNMVRLFLHFLLKANYEDKKWRGMTIKRGQFVTSLAMLHSETTISIQTLRTCIAKLLSTGEINKQLTGKFTIITICKYEDYQQVPDSFQHATNRQLTDNQQATNRQLTTTKEIKNIRNKEDNIVSTDVDTLSETSDPSQEELKLVVDFFNKTVSESGSIIPKVRSARGKRASAIKARIREYGIEAVYEVITKACQSDFMNGRNNRGWTATFDWIFLPTNFQKVLEGNYDNKIATNQINQNYGSTNTNRVGYVDQRKAEREQLARDYAATIARRLAEDDERATGVRGQEDVPL